MIHVKSCLLGDTFEEVLKEDVLPDGRLYWNIAERIISPMIINNHKLVNTASASTQRIIDLKDGIGLQPLKTKVPNERIKGLLDYVTVESIPFKSVQIRMSDLIVNITESFFDDFIKLNADFRYKAGLSPQIIRIVRDKKACKWCKALAGVYNYADLPKNSDVFKRHENCHCQVIYKTIKYKQDVWTKKKQGEQVDNTTIHDILYTGARIVDPSSDEAEEFAQMYYREIRSFSTDCRKIAENTGIEESEIRKIKQYLFFEGGYIDSYTKEFKHFMPDCAIAQSWQRLMLGDIKKHDYTLINHELYEMKIKNENPNISHTDAHTLATRKYDYNREAEEYYGNLKKHNKNTR